jgi:hypothetical protein
VKEIVPEEEKPSVPLRSAVGAALIIMHLVTLCSDCLLFHMIGPEIGSPDPCENEWMPFLTHLGFTVFFLLLGIFLVMYRPSLPEKARRGTEFCRPVGVALMETNTFLFCVPWVIPALTSHYSLPMECIPGIELIPLYLLHVGGFMVGFVVTMVGLLRALTRR